MRIPLLAATLLLAAPAALAADAAPGFTLRDVNGRSVALSGYQGQVVLISFWATWCAPCQAEMPHLQRFYETYGPQGFTVLSINTDDARSLSQVKPLVKSKGVTFPVLLDRETSVVALYNPAKTLPYSVLLDREGRIVQVYTGYSPGDETRVEAEIQNLLQIANPVQAAPPAAATP